MVANYATMGYTTVLSGAAVTVIPGETRDSVTDAAIIATWSTNWTATAPVAGAGQITGVLAGYLASYPRATVS